MCQLRLIPSTIDRRQRAPITISGGPFRVDIIYAARFVSADGLMLSDSFSASGDSTELKFDIPEGVTFNSNVGKAVPSGVYTLQVKVGDADWLTSSLQATFAAGPEFVEAEPQLLFVDYTSSQWVIRPVRLEAQVFENAGNLTCRLASGSGDVSVSMTHFSDECIVPEKTAVKTLNDLQLAVSFNGVQWSSARPGMVHIA